MGYEFKIRFSSTEQERQEITRILQECRPCTPQILDMKLEEDGIYICRYRTSQVWNGLKGLQRYLEEKGIAYSTEEL